MGHHQSPSRVRGPIGSGCKLSYPISTDTIYVRRTKDSTKVQPQSTFSEATLLGGGAAPAEQLICVTDEPVCARFPLHKSSFAGQTAEEGAK